ncbi:MAG TPA: DUF4157 domain-containing protein [Blastocatellia bacterium]|jgi:hypothetical protein|nr:DUF4157 domain-containing protein [Blastocatellia bacterium]
MARNRSTIDRRKSPGSALPESAVRLLAPYFPALDLRDIRVREGIPWYVLMGASAYTDRNRIYFAPGAYDPYSAEGIALIGHEITHSAQYEAIGTFKFRVLYLWEWLRGLYAHLSVRGAYARNPFEVAAARMQSRIYEDLSADIR